MTIAGGKVTRARIALGGVGTKPWRSPEAETALVGKTADAVNFRAAAEASNARRETAKRKQIQNRTRQTVPHACAKNGNDELIQPKE